MGGRRLVKDASSGISGGEQEGTNFDTGGFVQLVCFHSPRYHPSHHQLEREEKRRTRSAERAPIVPSGILHERAQDHLRQHERAPRRRQSPRARRPTEMTISTAPPPGTSVGLKTTFRRTDMASARFRSITLKMFLDGPRGKMAHALGVAHSIRKVKYLREIGSVEAF
jgi:hypothetical protein